MKTVTLATALMLLLSLPFATFAQYEENRGLFGRGGSSADYSYGGGESLMKQGEPNTYGTITNDSFGDAPLGSGIAILIAAGTGDYGSCGTVTIGGVEGAISTSPYTYQP